MGDGVRDVCRRSQGAMPSVFSAIIREPYGIFHDENAWQRLSLANTRGAVVRHSGVPDPWAFLDSTSGAFQSWRREKPLLRGH